MRRRVRARDDADQPDASRVGRFALQMYVIRCMFTILAVPQVVPYVCMCICCHCVFYHRNLSEE